MTAQQFRKDPATGKILLHATGHFEPLMNDQGQPIVDDNGNVDQEFIAEHIVGETSSSNDGAKQ